MTKIKMHISKVKLPFYPPCEVKCGLRNRVSTTTKSIIKFKICVHRDLMASYKEKIFMKFEANTAPLELEESSSKSRRFLNPLPLPPPPWTPHWSKLIKSLPETSQFVALFTSSNWGLFSPITIPPPPPFIGGSCQIFAKLYDDPSFIIAGESILKSLFTFIYKLNLTNKSN